MPRPPLIRTDLHPYHITSRCFNKEFFPAPLPVVWDVMVMRLRHCHKEFGLAIHALVLMGNHFHLLCHTPRSNLDQAMHYFLRMVALDVQRITGNRNQLWDDRYKWSLIDSQRHYYQVYRYIFQNPLRAKLVSKVEDYSFSSLKRELPFPLHSFVPMAFGGQEGEIQWLNERYDEEEMHLIKLGLRKHQFDINKRKMKIYNKLTVPSKPIAE